MGFKRPLMLTALLVIVLTRPAHAYLDANTGSLLIQLLVGGVAGIALVGKLMWHRITGVFRPNRDEEPEDH